MSTTGSCPSGAGQGGPRRSACLQKNLLRTILLAVWLASPLSAATAQDAEVDTAKAAAPADAPTAETPSEEQAASEPASADQPKADDSAPAAESPAGDETQEAAAPSTDATKASEATRATTGDATAAPDSGGISRPLTYGVIIIGLFVLPVILGNMLANWLRMPDYGWKISLVLGTLAASIVIVSLGEFKFGPDLAGGITLIYELAEQPAAADGEREPGGNIQIQELIDILKRRIDPTGTREVTIREYGPAIEIIIPNTGQDALEFVKRRITE
ncbi:MAG: hypothetical protein WD971_12195, partial [Pirellulales bacterium]